MGHPIALSKPEGGAERETVFVREHRCPQGDALRNSIDQVDLLFFPVGLAGWELPSDIPFVVETTEPCSACGAYVAAWFEWKSPMVVSSPLWKPGDE